MIALCKIVADTQYNSVIIDESPDSDLKAAEARVQRTATLDGGCVINNLGTCDGDRTFRVRASIDEDQDAALWDMYNAAAQVYVSTKEGVFSAAIKGLSTNNGVLDMTLYVSERMSE